MMTMVAIPVAESDDTVLLGHPAMLVELALLIVLTANIHLPREQDIRKASGRRHVQDL
jgi:hypothetical protein